MENKKELLAESLVKKGYKKTKLGWIPEEWRFEKSITATKYFGGGAFKSIHSTKNGVKWLKIANVGINKTKWENTSYLPETYKTEFAKYLLKKGDVVMALTRPILNDKLKIAKITDKDGDSLLNQRVAKLLPKPSSDVNFIYYVLQTPYFVNAMNGAMAGTDPPNIGNRDLESIKIPLPPLPEQQKIAKILSTWDVAIDKLSQLIAQKEKHKKGLMQVLLTGKVRFDGFTEEWKNTLVSNVFEFIHTNSFSRSNMEYNTDNNSVYNIHYGDIHATFKEPILDFEKENKIPVLLNDTELPKSSVFLNEGDLVMADASEDYAGVGETVELKNIKDKKVVGGLHTFVLRDKSEKTSKGFRTYIFKHPTVSNSVKVIATGSKVYGISKTNLAKVKLFLPSIGEQQKIASVLSSADAAIEKLKAQLAVLKNQKKGLMQELLTGKTRVKIN